MTWTLTFHHHGSLTAAEHSIHEYLASVSGIAEEDISMTFTTIIDEHETMVEAEFEVANDTMADSLITTLNALDLTTVQSDLTNQFTSDNVDPAPEVEAIGTAAEEEHEVSVPF